MGAMDNGMESQAGDWDDWRQVSGQCQACLCLVYVCIAQILLRIHFDDSLADMARINCRQPEGF